MTNKEALDEARRRWGSTALATDLRHRCYVGFVAPNDQIICVMGEHRGGCDFDKAFAHADTRPADYYLLERAALQRAAGEADQIWQNEQRRVSIHRLAAEYMREVMQT